jgi:predicted chitinase
VAVADKKAEDYVQVGPFDKAAFRAEYLKEFQARPKFNAASIPDVVQVLEMIEKDTKITDIRWMAYMLATTYLESSNTVKEERQVKDKKGNVTTKTVKVWKNFVPTEEKGHGKGLKYGKPVKVKSLPDGSARITEWDGDQWIVSPSGGNPRAQSKGAKLGADYALGAAKTYTEDDGDEHDYYGRGFVQITWWSNYASAGVMLGRGLELLHNPDLVTEAQTAYDILATGMRTGQSFANGRKLADYFHDTHTDYPGARAMVNGSSGKEEVAGFAEAFERALLASRLKKKEGATP